MDDYSSPGRLVRARLLRYMPEAAIQYGWTAEAVEAAANAGNVSKTELKLAAPAGSGNVAFALTGALLDDWASWADSHTSQILQDKAADGMRVRERIRLGVMTRISCLQPEAAARAAMLALLAPWRTVLSSRLLFRAADNIWVAMGDPSTDHNWYSKRLILSGIIANIVLIWLERGEDEAWQRLDVAIEGVMKFERFKGDLRRWRGRCSGMAR